MQGDLLSRHWLVEFCSLKKRDGIDRICWWWCVQGNWSNGIDEPAQGKRIDRMKEEEAQDGAYKRNKNSPGREERNQEH